VDVFLGGSGGEEKASGHGQQGRSLDDTRFQTAPFCYILYVEQWKFPCSMSSGHREGGPRSSFALGRHVLCFSPRQPVDLYHPLKTTKGLLSLVPPRTPRSSGYDVYADVVYVVTCYMSVICICLLYVVICYMSGYMLYVCYMSSSRTLLIYVYVCYMLLYVICL
jgi:hypothetical protein